LLAFNGEHSLLQNTLKRIALIKDLAKPIIVCNEAQRFTVQAQVEELGFEVEAIIVEPEGRNTAASIALAAVYCMKHDANPLLLVFPSDHHVENEEEFCSSIKRLCHTNINDTITTLGIKPQNPDTGYGYIKVGELLENAIYKVSEFTEKPSKEIAENYVKSGNYLWNSGIFVAHAETLQQEFESFAADTIKICKKSLKISEGKKFIEVGKTEFAKCANISFDYAIMEKTGKAVVMPINMGWNDLGDWQRVWESSLKDADNNMLKGESINVDTHNSYIWTNDRSLMVTIGLDNLVIIQTADVCLVANKNNLDQLSTILQKMKLENRKELLINKKMHRPWGNYENLTEGPRYQVKRVVVKPGEKLSLQMHCHRSEHWVVVQGTGKITRGEEEIILTENESTYIPSNTLHRIENIGKLDLEIVEVQVGSYLGEDDIIRIDDQYGRKE
jgi:mannose-1-phosphate guanylyltransferase/mannose-6-phosphate isomerase